MDSHPLDKPVLARAEESGKSFRSGFVTLVGRPNAGKSTLLNAIMGKKIAITSDTVQTTRHRFRAVLSRPGYQLVIVDTPGLHKPQDLLGEELNAAALAALADVDVAAMLIDAAKPVGKGDVWVAGHLATAKAHKIAVVSKTDLTDKPTLARQLSEVAALAPWDAVVPLSAASGDNLDVFLTEVVSLLPEGPLWFPADMETDQPLEVMVAEFVREKVLRSFREEVPHAIGVKTDELEFLAAKRLYRIHATLFVERESQKGMIIGKNGARIKEMGTQARLDLEHLLGCRVFLDLKVKVKKNWRRDLAQIRRFGYGEGAY
ncbi:MAG: GTPase Era [Coriobacteriaceae bacterium]|jgi:GTP-binding protein Era|nr:GTPase Era [Coriobacteriaceae bacterium]